ncbi:MAG TPA: ATP-binding cassette domain-containing protein [Bacteriovoracaceae bacterium]|nr:ATP-binding cassette domain-containing protein [Bacteriovoracaceae bacterium]
MSEDEVPPDFEGEFSVSFKNMSKSFGEAKILNDLSFDIHTGKITTILGFSGAGKTTLMKTILGLTMPTSGDVEVLGKTINKLGDLELREFRRNFGMVFQYAALFDFLTSFENVAFPLREFTKMTEDEIKEKVLGLLDSVGIEKDAAYRLPSELSGGMRKRVGLARGLSLDPHIMLYDEPTSGLDPITTHMVYDLMKETHNSNAERGFTSIIISHDIHATLKYSDYIVFMEKGCVVEHNDVENFKKSENPVIRRFLEL